MGAGHGGARRHTGQQSVFPGDRRRHEKLNRPSEMCCASKLGQELSDEDEPKAGGGVRSRSPAVPVLHCSRSCHGGVGGADTFMNTTAHTHPSPALHRLMNVNLTSNICKLNDSNTVSCARLKKEDKKCLCLHLHSSHTKRPPIFDI